MRTAEIAPKSMDEAAGAMPVAATPAGAGLPLIVDLDGTLLRTDTLMEAFADNLRRRPLQTVLSVLKLPFIGIARFKRELTANTQVDIDVLPANDAVIAHIQAARDAGRKVWLVSAADQKMVDAVAARFGFFDRAIGSDGVRNLKGARKAKLLAESFPDGFEYVGDSPADVKVWRVGLVAAHVGGGEARRRQLEKQGVKVTASLPTGATGSGAKAWRKELRMHQWAKNGMLFVAPVLALRLLNAETFGYCLAGFLCLSLMASGTYLLNDLVDLSADRRHHTKRNRPFASGRIKLWQGMIVSPALIAGGMAAGWLVSPLFGVCLVIYLVTTLSYSFYIKRVPLLDTLLLAFLYTLRLVMGGVLAGVPVTEWLLVFSMFLFFSLSLAKRHVEVVRKADAGINHVANRGYVARDAALTLGMGLASATATPVILALYIIGEARPSGLYSHPEMLWGAPIMLTLWLSRVWLLANRAELDDDPVSFAVRDPISILIGAGLAVFFAAAAFLPAGALLAGFTR